MRLLDEIHLERPFYGSRRLRDELETQGHPVNRKRVQRLMRQMDLSALYPKPRTSQPGAGHKVYPYLLKGLSIERPNQVWASDICYIPMAQGFMYLVAILDWYSRRVLAWRVSNTFDSDCCVEALEDALIHYGPPAIFNTDQGAQVTSQAFTTVLKAHAVAISMDGKGRWVDNVFVERLWRSVDPRLAPGRADLALEASYPPCPDSRRAPAASRAHALERVGGALGRNSSSPASARPAVSRVPLGAARAPLQYGPRRSGHVPGVYDGAQSPCGGHQHGRQGTLGRQRVRRASLAQRQIRGCVSPCIRDTRLAPGRADLLLSVLQRATAS